MLVPCYTFVVLLLVASSYGEYLSVTRGDDGPYDLPTKEVKKSFRIPAGQGTGWLTENELSCIVIDDRTGEEIKYAAELVSVDLIDKAYPDITVADDLLSAKIYRGQIKGSVQVNVNLLCKNGIRGQRLVRHTRETALIDLKPVAFEE